MSRITRESSASPVQSLTFTNSISTTAEIEFAWAAGGTIFFASNPGNLTFYAANDLGGTFQAAYDQTGTAITMTVSAAGAYQIPSGLFGARAIKVVTTTASVVGSVNLKG